MVVTMLTILYCHYMSVINISCSLTHFEEQATFVLYEVPMSILLGNTIKELHASIT